MYSDYGGLDEVTTTDGSGLIKQKSSSTILTAKDNALLS